MASFFLVFVKMSKTTIETNPSAVGRNATETAFIAWLAHSRNKYGSDNKKNKLKTI